MTIQIIRNVVLSCFILILTKCRDVVNETASDNKVSKIDTKQTTDSLYKLEGENFFKKYKTLSGTDTLAYTYQLQQLIKDSSAQPFGLTGYIDDIIRHKDGYIIKMQVFNFNEKALANLFIDSISFNTYKEILIADGEKYVVAKLNTFKISFPQLSATATKKDEDDYETDITLDFDNQLMILDGNFIDCLSEK